MAKRRQDPDADSLTCRLCGLLLPAGDFAMKPNGIRESACKPCRYKNKQRGARAALRQCALCGVSFQPKDKKYATYCTRECGWAGQWQQRREAFWLGKFSPLPWKTCLQCGGEFYARGTALVCSDACRASRGYQRRSGTAKAAVCVECGVSFTFAIKASRPSVTCSAQCKERRSAQTQAASSAKSKVTRAARMQSQPSELVRPIEIYLRDGWRCQICGGQVDKRAKVPHSKAPTLDHIIPVSMGGPHTRQNLRLAHFLCNSKRGNRESAQMLLIG